MINHVQKIVLDLMKSSSFNEFNGEKVTKALEDHQDLWRGAIWGRFQYGELIPLRDIAENQYNADTLMCLVPQDKADEFINLMRGMSADEVHDITDEIWTGDHFGHYTANGNRIIRVWWD